MSSDLVRVFSSGGMALAALVTLVAGAWIIAWLAGRRPRTLPLPIAIDPPGQEWTASYPPRLWADFNGLFGDVLCLSHRGTCIEHTIGPINVREGMHAVACDDELVADGKVEQAPEWLRCKGSTWVLRIDQRGVRDLHDGNEDSKA